MGEDRLILVAHNTWLIFSRIPFVIIPWVFHACNSGVRTKNGVITVHLRVAIAIRLLAGGNYMDIAVVFGVGISTVFSILWQVVDAINSNPAVGPFFFPQSEEECARAARRWKVRSKIGVWARHFLSLLGTNKTDC